MADVNKIKEELFSLMEQRDQIAPRWAEAKARSEQLVELRKTRLARIAQRMDGKSEAEKERKALATQEYEGVLKRIFQEREKYLLLDSQMSGIDKAIDILRSMLSFEKTAIELNI